MPAPKRTAAKTEDAPKQDIETPDVEADAPDAPDTPEVPEGAPALESPETPAPPPFAEQGWRTPAHAPGHEDL
jgi:hypothetical protein